MSNTTQKTKEKGDSDESGKKRRKKQLSYKYEYNNLSFNSAERATVDKALEILRNHYRDQFKPRELKTRASLFKTIGIAFCIDIIVKHEEEEKRGGR